MNGGREFPDNRVRFRFIGLWEKTIVQCSDVTLEQSRTLDAFVAF